MDIMDNSASKQKVVKPPIEGYEISKTLYNKNDMNRASNYIKYRNKTFKQQNDIIKMFYYQSVRNKSKVYIPKQKMFTQGVNHMKYRVQIDSNLVKLINWTNPKYPKDVKYVIENKYLCASVRKLAVLVVVNSATDHFDRRQAIRLTWTNDKYYSHLGTVRVVFLLGKSANLAVQMGIEKEAEISRDILQGNFMDTYCNLTHKGIMGLKWITERCRNAQVILKVDDDFMVNMFIYLRKLKTLHDRQVYCDYHPDKIPREENNKWVVSEDHFKGQTHYKPFCKGKFVSMTNSIIPYLYESATKTPFFPYDDVLLFGYVIHNVKTIRVKSLKRTDMTTTNYIARKCLDVRKYKCTRFVIGADNEREMRITWYKILKNFGNVKFSQNSSDVYKWPSFIKK
ncbi:beta-1,3-galactosyltransferase 1-like [Ruditapes philippinarum]|uniref:beta-1,3-galactosyltransferase 1-like n=1 Tax=Ruditapes philippinarum TaxID=129788 RepID=UPI00295AD732|nr:beta-1,3-galactosyltransferase 1-like [Ruditapes philippinarum]